MKPGDFVVSESQSRYGVTLWLKPTWWGQNVHVKDIKSSSFVALVLSEPVVATLHGERNVPIYMVLVLAEDCVGYVDVRELKKISR